MAASLHLDTNVLVLGLNPAHPMRDQVRYWRDTGVTMAVSTMVWAEFLCGPVSRESIRAWEQVLAGRILALDARIAEQAAALFNQTGRRLRSLPDCIIAATAINQSAKLATLNREDFAPFASHGLQLA